MLCDYCLGGFMGPEGFLKGRWEVSFEHKKLMNGEIGPNTGEQGTVTQRVVKDPLADVLLALEPHLVKLGHIGDFSIGVGIDKKGKAWPFEFTVRLGYPAWFLQIASIEGDPLQWMKDLIDGKDSLKVTNDVCIGVVCAQPPYPSEKFKAEEVEGEPIEGVEPVRDQVHPCAVMIGTGPVMDGGKVVDKPMWQTSAPYVMVVTGLGDSVQAARNSVYGAIDEISFPDMMYRTDIGDKVIKNLPELHRHGYALAMEGEAKKVPVKPAAKPQSAVRSAMMLAAR
jgi:phosphoribosylamine--glycine ligase